MMVKQRERKVQRSIGNKIREKMFGGQLKIGGKISSECLVRDLSSEKKNFSVGGGKAQKKKVSKS